MPVRLAMLLAVSAAVLAVPAADAGVLCRQLIDAAGDARFLSSTNTTGALAYQALDILSADIATGRHNLVAALRVTTLERDQTLPGGSTYYLRWTQDGETQVLSYLTYAGSPPTAEWRFDPGPGPSFAVPGTADHGVITWTVPRKYVLYVKRGARLVNLTAQTMFSVNDHPPAAVSEAHYHSEADLATTKRTYTDGTPTCLKGT